MTVLVDGGAGQNRNRITATLGLVVHAAGKLNRSICGFIVVLLTTELH